MQARTPEAATVGQACAAVNWPMKSGIISVIVAEAIDLLMIRGIRNSFQESRNVKIPVANRPGVDTGIMTL